MSILQLDPAAGQFTSKTSMRAMVMYHITRDGSYLAQLNDNGQHFPYAEKQDNVNWQNTYAYQKRYGIRRWWSSNN